MRSRIETHNDDTLLDPLSTDLFVLAMFFLCRLIRMGVILVFIVLFVKVRRAKRIHNIYTKYSYNSYEVGSPINNL